MSKDGRIVMMPTERSVASVCTWTIAGLAMECRLRSTARSQQYSGASMRRRGRPGGREPGCHHQHTATAPIQAIGGQAGLVRDRLLHRAPLCSPQPSRRLAVVLIIACSSRLCLNITSWSWNHTSQRGAVFRRRGQVCLLRCDESIGRVPSCTRGEEEHLLSVAALWPLPPLNPDKLSYED